MKTLEQLQDAYRGLMTEGTRLAGGLADVSQRAATYHHLYEDSGGNHIFPLIAAHGALWSRGYFAKGMKLGSWLAWQFPFSAETRKTQLGRLATFADQFREINRQVCADTYASYHFTARFGDDPGAARFINPPLLAALNTLHDARRGGISLSDDVKRKVFEAHFLNEQQTVVAPRIEEALKAFDWPLMQFLALRPRVQFAYFPNSRAMRFHQFDNTPERIARGLDAFDIAAEAGWRHVVSTLKNYAVLPSTFFVNSAEYFAAMRTSVLEATT